jgi:voltage-gated potassium channel
MNETSRPPERKGAGLAPGISAILDPAGVSRPSRAYRKVEVVLALTGILAMMLATEAGPATWGLLAFVASLATLFLVDFALRLWVAPLQRAELSPALARWAWLRTGRACICLLSCAPLAAALPLGWQPDGAPLLAVLWCLRLARYSRGVEVLVAVLIREREAIRAVLVVFLSFLMGFAVLGYLAEREAQPAHFGTLPKALWWTITTITTTGYGDAVPGTVAGRILAGFAMTSGIVVFGLFAGILATGFSQEVRRREFLQAWDLVHQVPMFHEVGAGTMAELANLLRPQDVAARTVITRRGQAGDCMYFIVSGGVEVLVEPMPVRLGPGDFFGEIALVTGGTRTATVIATDDTSLLVLDVADFRALASNRGELHAIIKREAERRLADIEPG